MVEAANTTDRQRHDSWQFSLRSLFLLTLSVAVGLSFWKMDQDWFAGILIAIAPWIALGLAAQVRDIWNSSRQGEELTHEDRWGRRFAIFWRLAICALFGVCFVVPLLVSFHVMVPSDSIEFIQVSSRTMWRAVLVVSIIVALASSPRLARSGRRRPWSWVVGMFGGVAAFVLFMVLLIDRLCVVSMVHITIAGILSAAPLWCAEDTVSTYSRGRVERFFDVTTSAVVAILISGVLLRLLSLGWRRAMWQKLCLGALLAISLAVMLILTTKVLIAVPAITPVLAATIPPPTPYRFAPAALLALLLTAVVAYRWSKQPVAGLAPAAATWRCDADRYYHERLAVLLLLAGVGLVECIDVARGMYASPWADWFAIVYAIIEPMGALSLALVLLAAQGVFSGWSKRREAVAVEPSRLPPVLFLLVWAALLAIVLCSAPIFAAWGFAVWLK